MRQLQAFLFLFYCLFVDKYWLLSFSFDDGDFDDAEEDEGLDDLENVEDVRRWSDTAVNI